MSDKQMSIETLHSNSENCESSFHLQAESIFNDCNDDSVNILSVDDDSLLYILKFLPLRDKLSFVCAHRRFAAIFQMHAKSHVREITEYDLQHLTQLEIGYFFEVAGKYLETLTLLAGFEQYSCKSGFTLIKQYCSNLKKLSLWGNFDETDLHFERFRELLLNKPNLRTLRLQRLCLKDDSLTLMLEPELPKLEHLSIVYCKEFSGYCLLKLKNLKKLRLENLDKLNFIAVGKALSQMPNLYALSYLEAEVPDEVSRCFVEVLNNLLMYNKNLEILELNMHNTINVNVSQSPKLKHFTYGIRDNYWQTTIEFIELLDQKKNSLESLRIVSFWDFQFSVEHCQLISDFTNLKKLHLPWKDLSKHGITINDDSLRHLCALQNLVEFKACGENSFTKDGLLELVQNCRNLKWVNIQCSLIDNKFAKELIPVIADEATRRHGRITFLVYGSKMNKFNFPEAYNSNEMKDLVEFLFEELFTLESYDNFYDDFEHDSNFMRTPFCSHC